MKANKNQKFMFWNQLPNQDTVNPGKIVQRYNISEAHIELYFIPLVFLEAYENARSRQDLNASQKYGMRIN